MFYFGDSSKKRLVTLSPDLQKLLKTAIRYWDFTIVDGHRDEEAQNRAYNDGKSELRYPNSKHNLYPSHAVDIAPWRGRIIWGETKAERDDIIYMMGSIMGLAKGMLASGEIKHEMRWGGDWNMNSIVNDESFEDLFHIEQLGD